MIIVDIILLGIPIIVSVNKSIITRLAGLSLSLGAPLHVMLVAAGEKLSESNASDVRELCTTLLNCYLIQLLETGFLHADPHPGNLIRTPDGKICILDFGLMTEVRSTAALQGHHTSSCCRCITV